MKRDWQVVCETLEAVEKMDRPHDFPNFEGVQGRYGEFTLDYHLKLLVDTGLISGTATWMEETLAIDLRGLTWAGHDLLDRLRDRDNTKPPEVV